MCPPLPRCCNHLRSSQTLICFWGPLMISRKPVRLVHCMLFCIKWYQAGSADGTTFRAFLSSLMMQSPKQQEFWNVSVWSENDKATWELIGKSYPGPRSSSSSSSCRKSAQFFLRRALSVCMTYTPCQFSLFQWEAWQNQNSFAKNLQIYSFRRC